MQNKDYYEPVPGELMWTGHGWKYHGKIYPSLRILKSKQWFKYEKSFVKILSGNMMREIDRMILDDIQDTNNDL